MVTFYSYLHTRIIDHADDAKSFPKLFNSLDASSDVVNYGLSVTTLEEVFMRVGHEDEDDNKVVEDNKAKEMNNVVKENNGKNNDASALKIQLERSTFPKQLKALILKRFHVQKRDRYAFLCQCVIPLVILILLLAITSASYDRPVYRYTSRAQRSEHVPTLMPHTFL